MSVIRKRYLLRFLLVSCISFFMCSRTPAQPWPNDPGGGVGTDPGEPGTEDDPPDDGYPDPDLPIDSNILILVVVVMGYGLKKVWDVRKDIKRKKDSLQTIANYEDFIK